MISWKLCEREQETNNIFFRKESDGVSSSRKNENGFFYEGLFQYNKNTEDYFHNPVLAMHLCCTSKTYPLPVTMQMYTVFRSRRKCA